jgi:hypothetical protein
VHSVQKAEVPPPPTNANRAQRRRAARDARRRS